MSNADEAGNCTRPTQSYPFCTTHLMPSVPQSRKRHIFIWNWDRLDVIDCFSRRWNLFGMFSLTFFSYLQFVLYTYSERIKSVSSKSIGDFGNFQQIKSTEIFEIINRIGPSSQNCLIFPRKSPENRSDPMSARLSPLESWPPFAVN